MDKREYTTGEIILGTVFAIWFFAKGSFQLSTDML